MFNFWSNQEQHCCNSINCIHHICKICVLKCQDFTIHSIVKMLPVTLILTSMCLSWVTGTVDRLVTTPRLTVLGMTAPVPPWSLLPLGQRWWVGAAPFSAGMCRKSLTSCSQSKMRKTRRLFKTTVKHEESRVDLCVREREYSRTSIYSLDVFKCFQWRPQTCNVAPAAVRLG